MESLIYKLAVRRVGHRRTQAAEETTPATSRDLIARRAKLFRRGLIFVLSAIGATAFIEVVLLPGKLVRERYSTLDPSANHLESDDDAKFGALRPFLTGDAERNRQAEVRRFQAQKRLIETYNRLANRIAIVDSLVQQSMDYLQSELGATPDVASPRWPIPASLIPVLADEPTAQSAWADLIRTQGEMRAALREAHALDQLLAGRFAANTYFDDDETSMNATFNSLANVMVASQRCRADIDHLSVLSRGRAALVRQADTKQYPGDLP